MHRLEQAESPPTPLCRLLFAVALFFLLCTSLRAEEPLPQVMPGAPPAAEVAEWWISPEGQPLGPYSEAELVQLAEAGEIDTGTYVWRADMEAWALLGEVEALGKVASAARHGEAEGRKQEFAAYLVGSWYFEGPQEDDEGPYYMKLFLTFRPDGSFAGSEHVKAPGYDAQVIVRKGRWKMEVTGEKTFDLQLTEVGEPYVWNIEILGPDMMENAYDRARFERQ